MAGGVNSVKMRSLNINKSDLYKKMLYLLVKWSQNRVFLVKYGNSLNIYIIKENSVYTAILAIYL